MKVLVAGIGVVASFLWSTDAFLHPSSSRVMPKNHHKLYARKTIVQEPPELVETNKLTDNTLSSKNALIAAAATSALTVPPSWAATSLDFNSIKTGLTPETFQPVCSTSDGLYRVLQQTAQTLVGPENFADYGPLIASGLLRVRLELCVVESFFNEAVGPFIRDNGLSWVLPLHETVETFLAGGIFALATTFILIGSTKLVTVIITYTDFLLGLPSRIFGGFAFDRAQGKPVTLDIGVGKFKKRVIGPPEEDQKAFDIKGTSIPGLIVLVISGALNYFGIALGFIREAFEAIDAFIGRYLVLWATFYLLIKFLHFKVFPDFPY